MEFFQKRASLKKPIPKHFFTSYYRICRWKNWFPLATSYQ
jgi:predicted  nucleic acid-binding Zn-ribbon protein